LESSKITYWIRETVAGIILLGIYSVPYYIAYNKNMNKTTRFLSIFAIIILSSLIGGFGFTAMANSKNYIIKNIGYVLSRLMVILIIYTMWYVYTT